MPSPSPSSEGALSRWVRLCASRPVALGMIGTAVAVFGALSITRLPLALMPEMSYPRLTIRTEFPGAAPEEVETLVARPLEESLGIVSGLVGLTSVSRAGTADVVLEFAWGTDMDLAALDVREKLDQMQLPREAKKPLLLRYDPSLDPMMRLALTGPMPEVSLRRLAEEEVKRDLEGIPGVAAVVPRGGLEEEIRIRMNETLLTRLGLDIGAVSERLAQENLNLASGLLREGETEYLVRTLNEFKSVGEIGNLVVAEKSGVPIRLSEVGTVTRDTKPQKLITRVDGQRGVIIDLHREADANIVRLARNVRTRLFGHGGTEESGPAPESAAGPGLVRDAGTEPPLFRRLPLGVRLHVLADQSAFIGRALSEVWGSAVSGGLLAIAILYLFLRNVITTGIIGLSIPISIVATFAGMHLTGVSLNLMSLGGIVLGIGMLVDNSIVVLESITYRRERGDSRLEASVRGTAEVFMAVTASTLTTVAVFLPIVFVEGVAGQIFKDLSLTVVLSLSSSLIGALVFVPMLASMDGSAWFAAAGPAEPWVPPGVGAWRDVRGLFAGRGVLGIVLLLPYAVVRLPLQAALELLFTLIRACVAVAAGLTAMIVRVTGGALRFVLSPVLTLFGRFWDACANGYPGFLRTALAHRAEALAIPLALFVGAWLWIPRLGRELMPSMHEGEFTCELGCPVGTPIDATDQIVSGIEADVKGDPRIASFHTVIGADVAAQNATDEGEHTARLTVRLAPARDMAAAEEAVMETLRQRLSREPGLATWRFTRPALFTLKTPVEVEVRGEDLAVLRTAAREAYEAMETIPGLQDLKMSLQPGHPEIVIVPDRERIAALGLNVNEIATIIGRKVRENVATKYRERDRQIEVLVRVDEAQSQTPADLAELVVNPGGTVPTRLRSVATLEKREGPSEIRRIGHQRAVVISADPGGADLAGTVAAVRSRLSSLPAHADVTYTLSGQNREMEVSSRSLTMALWLSLFLVYIIMASQFESLMHPFVIMFTMPLGLVGVVAACGLTGTPFSILVYIGLIVLAGVVVNNAIVLVDCVNRLREEGVPRLEALAQAGRVRLRPILMTTLTTVLGLLPMALGIGEGSEIRQPLALTILAGLTSATLLTLVVIPVVYSLLDRTPDAAKGANH